MERPLANLILSADRGDGQASEALFSALYRELRGLARRELARLGPGAALGATSLLHEAYLDMDASRGRPRSSSSPPLSWAPRGSPASAAKPRSWRV
jgi:hypothetical protein